MFVWMLLPALSAEKTQKECQFSSNKQSQSQNLSFCKILSTIPQSNDLSTHTIYSYETVFPRDCLTDLLQYSYSLFCTKQGKRVKKIANPLGFHLLKQFQDTQVKLGILWIQTKRMFLLAVENGILDYVGPYYNYVWKCIMQWLSIQCD